jgi:hypothetical protein
MEIFELTQVFSVFGVGVHVLIAVCFAIHAIRTGRNYYWLWILFVFPFLGSVVYFFAEYLPSSRLQRNASSVGQMAIKLLNPRRNLKKAQHDYEVTPSVNHAVIYAAALTAAGKPQDAVALYEEKITGFCANDQNFLEQMAYALLDAQQGQRALDIVQRIRAIDAAYKPETVALLHALSFDSLGQDGLAQSEFVIATRTRDMTALSQYALWAAMHQHQALALSIQVDMQKNWKVWPAHSKRLYKPVFKQVDQAITAMKKRLKKQGVV